MNIRIKSSLLVTVLAVVLASLGFVQEQGKDQPPATAPQTSPDNDTQNTAPPQNQPEQVAPKPGEPTPPSQSAPATQEQAPPQEEAQPAPQAAPEANNPAKPKPSAHKAAQKKMPKAKKPAQAKPAHQPKTTTPSSSAEPGKVVVRNGGASDDVIHLSPGGSQEQNAHNRENTEQLLATTDENLKRLSGRQLSTAEQGTVDQIHSYMRQAKSAADSGDLTRAHTLAFKAHLLSDDLAKH